ncbi:MAG: NAD(P)-dependent oxidoreductase [Chloroflexota bacterium]|nr:MAG: NAD(P)-dependent oxidoreductase [Chloroflexota bacterium]
MQITITGSAGSFATYLIKELEPAYDLVLFDRVRPDGNRLAGENRHSIVVGDLTCFEDCQRAVAGSHAIMHIGAIPFAAELPWARAAMESGRMPLLPLDETMRVNTMGTYYLLEAARRAAVATVVMASSGAVLGLGARPSGTHFTPAYLPVDEAHPLAPEDTYALSKVFGEEMLAAFSRGYGLRGYALRLAGILRPGLTPEFVREHAAPTGWNNWLYNYIDARDAARAFRMCLDAAERLPAFDVFFVTAPDSFLIETTRELLARLRPDLVGMAAGLGVHQALISPDKAERSFGFRAEHRWTELLAEAPAR